MSLFLLEEGVLLVGCAIFGALAYSLVGWWGVAVVAAFYVLAHTEIGG